MIKSLAISLGLAAGLAAQVLTLPQAETLALQKRPLVQEAQALALAAGEQPQALRSQYFPQLSGSLTAVGAEHNSRIGAGGLNNPVIFSRYADGLALSQFLTDFGRSGNLMQSAQFAARAQQQTVAATRADVLLQVDEAYYGALQAQAVLQVAREAVTARQLVARQVGVLANNKLRSTLDVSFAQVNLDQAQLLLSQADAAQKASLADLALAIGTRFPVAPGLQEEPLPAAPADLAAAVAGALRQRPELVASNLHDASTRAFAQAQRDLWRPTLSAVGAAGLIPTGAPQLPSRYAAAGVNLSLPLFNGGLFASERHAAEDQADAAHAQQQQLQQQIEHDVQTAWLNARTAQDQLALTQHLQQQAALALRLAQSRYTLGLGTIVELSQAQLNQTQADIAAAQAKYRYQLASARLNYQTGTLH